MMMMLWLMLSSSSYYLLMNFDLDFVLNLLLIFGRSLSAALGPLDDAHGAII